MYKYINHIYFIIISSSQLNIIFNSSAKVNRFCPKHKNLVHLKFLSSELFVFTSFNSDTNNYSDPEIGIS